MYRRRVVVSSVDDVNEALERLPQEIAHSKIPDAEARYLLEQIKITIRQFERQLTTPSMRVARAEREFEGRGFQVRLQLRTKRNTLSERLRMLLGLGKGRSG